MKKAIILLVNVVLAFSVSAGSISDFFRSTGVELGDGIGFPLKEGLYSSSKPAWSIIIDFTYSLPEKPWDFGIFMHSDDAVRAFKKMEKAKFRRASFGVDAAYNFNKYKKIDPFVWLGLGTCANHTDFAGISSRTWYPAAMIKSGVEFHQFLRLAAYCHISKSEFSTAGLSLGIVFGSAHERVNNTKE